MHTHKIALQCSLDIWASTHSLIVKPHDVVSRFLRMNLDDHLNLDRRAKGQFSDTDCGARMFPGLAKDLL
jgi:hypothetical protein